MEQIKKILKAYMFKPDRDSDCGIAVIAESAKAAKKIGWNFWESEYGIEDEYVDCRVKLIKDARIEGLSSGALDDSIEGLKRGLYGYVEEAECPRCSNTGTVYWDDGFFCGNCEDMIKCEKCNQFTKDKDTLKCSECDEI